MAANYLPQPPPNPEPTPNPDPIVNVFTNTISAGQYLYEIASAARVLHQPQTTENCQKLLKAEEKICIAKNRIDFGFEFVPMGFEYTFFPPKGSQMELEYYESKIEKKQSFHKKCHSVYIDGPCIEICSPVHKTMEDAISFYREMIKITKSLGLRPVPKEQASGGLHVNCAIPGNKTIKGLPIRGFAQKFMKNMGTDIANRPYLNWLFNDPLDIENGNCMWDEEDGRLTACNYEQYGSKNTAINVKDKFHFEFRIFDMVNSERELKGIIDFVNAYMKFIYKQTLNNQKISRSPLIKDFMVKAGYYPMKREVVLKEWYKLLKQLKLETKRYNRYIKNLDTRYNLIYEDGFGYCK